MDDLIDSIPKDSLYICTIDKAKAYRSGSWHFKGFPLKVSVAVALFQKQMEAITGEDLIAAGV